MMEKIRVCVVVCVVCLWCGVVVVVCVFAGGFGVFWGRVEVDVLKLWVDV